MRDKNLVALITIIFLLIYLIPNQMVKLISIAFILFFAPGYFTVKIYRETSPEEEILLAVPISMAISGFFAVILSALSILEPLNLMVLVNSFIAISYFFANSKEMKKIKIPEKLPDKFAGVVIVLLLTGLSMAIYVDFSVPKVYEASIEIDSWPQNATLNSTGIFVLYVKNYNYPTSNFTVRFSLNSKYIEKRSFTLAPGKEIPVVFQSKITKSGKNLASFDLYINDNYYTNVHIYFYVK